MSVGGFSDGCNLLSITKVSVSLMRSKSRMMSRGGYQETNLSTGLFEPVFVVEKHE